MKIVKRLIFHLYVYENCFTSRVYKLHLKCLSLFSHIFDEAIFVISVNNTEDAELIKRTREWIINSINIKSIKFIVKQNNEYREAETFYEQVVKRLDKLDGLTFFAHIKGAGNELYSSVNINEIYNWVIALYFLNLAHIDDVETTVTHPYPIVYGALKSAWDNIENLNNWVYSGTFFWINTKRLSFFLKKYGVNVPDINNRYYAETFLGNIFSVNSSYAYSRNGIYFTAEHGIECLDYYNNAGAIIENFLVGDDREAFYEFRDNILKYINNEE